MSGLILRNNLNEICFKSCYRLTKILKLPPTKSFTTKNSGFLLQKQQIPASHIVSNALSKALTHKQYKSSRKYTLTWKSERLLGWSLIVLIPMAFFIEYKELEMALSTVALVHTYWGCQSMCSDYLRSSVVGKLLPVIVRLSIIFMCLTSLAGAYQLIYEDVGLIKMIKKVWSIRGRDYVARAHLRKV